MFTIAILGRPNVGKSSLFNRLVGRQKALVHPTPGVSRDWREASVQLAELNFNIIDTPGLEEAPPDSLVAQMSQTAKHAAERADLCIMLVDARAGVLPEELHFAKQLRQMNKPIILAANKCEGGIEPDNIDGIWQFGLGGAIPLSAAHGEGLAELHNALIDHVKEEGDTPEPGFEDRNEVSIAIIGRPNVGKSSLVNRLVGQERMLTGDTPGITRDAIDISWEWNGQKLRLVDTAGMRRPSRIEEKLEQLAVADSLKAIRQAEVVVLLLDATQGFERQDARLANRVVEAGKGLVIGVNKIDLLGKPNEQLKQIQERIEETLPQVAGLNLTPVCALDGTGIDALMETVFSMHQLWCARIPTAQLNQWLRDVIKAHPLPMRGRSRLRLRYATQVDVCPPSFALFCNRAALPDSYRRYLMKEARIAFGLHGVPMRWHVRVGKNPYA